MGFSEGFRVFYFDGYEYQEIAEQGEENSGQKSFLVEMYDYYSFTITIPQGDENTGVLIIWMNE